MCTLFFLKPFVVKYEYIMTNQPLKISESVFNGTNQLNNALKMSVLTT